jgi:hypothetical protein
MINANSPFISYRELLITFYQEGSSLISNNDAVGYIRLSSRFWIQRSQKNLSSFEKRKK